MFNSLALPQSSTSWHHPSTQWFDTVIYDNVPAGFTTSRPYERTHTQAGRSIIRQTVTAVRFQLEPHVSGIVFHRFSRCRRRPHLSSEDRKLTLISVSWCWCLFVVILSKLHYIQYNYIARIISLRPSNNAIKTVIVTQRTSITRLEAMTMKSQSTLADKAITGVMASRVR